VKNKRPLHDFIQNLSKKKLLGCTLVDGGIRFKYVLTKKNAKIRMEFNWFRASSIFRLMRIMGG
jgi:hypothetical protein